MHDPEPEEGQPGDAGADHHGDAQPADAEIAPRHDEHAHGAGQPTQHEGDAGDARRVLPLDGTKRDRRGDAQHLGEGDQHAEDEYRQPQLAAGAKALERR